MENGFRKFKSLSIYFIFLIGLAFSASMVVAFSVITPATKWVASDDNNHHIHGILSFPNQNLEGTQLVQLIIKNIGDSSDRFFEWHTPVTKQ